MPLTTPLPFGPLLKRMRKQAGMTQRDLAAALGYSESLICSLEKGHRLPDLQAVTARFIPALGLQADPVTAAALIEQAAVARGQRAPVAVTVERTTLTVVQAERVGQTHQLPSLPTALIGRTREVNQLGNRLLSHGGRLLTLVGPPGVGKTTLALALATHVQPLYRDGACFVPLAAISDPQLMAATIVATVAPGDASAKPPQTRLIELLRRQAMLLVLDNLEQIEGAAPSIAALLAECSALVILATSRERLHLRAEQRFKVPPLDLASAVELFVQRAQAVDSDFSLTPHNGPTLEAICKRLDRLPLALELCAAQIELFSPAQLLSELQAYPLDLLVDGAHDLPPQQRTLRAAIQRSYRLLAGEERTLLRSLGIFVGGFALPEVAAVMEGRWEMGDRSLNDAAIPQSLVALLRSLVSKSLVSTETTPVGEQRFLLLETIREFALEQVRIQGEETLLRQRHYAAYLHLVRTGDSYLRGPQAIYWFQRLDAEQGNLRAALQWALEGGRYHDLAWMGVALFWFWHRRGHFREALLWMEPLLSHRHTLPSDLRLAYLHVIFTAWAALGEYQRADQNRQELVELAQVCDNQNLRAATLFAVAVSTPNFSEAAAAFEETIALARQIEEPHQIADGFCIIGNDTPHLLASALHWYGALRLGRGDYEQATELCTESLTLLRAMGNCDTIAHPLGNLGRLALMRGEVTQAHAWIAEAVSVTQVIGNQDGLAHWLPWLARTKFYLGEAETAWQLFNQARQLCFDISYYPLLPNIATGLAIIALHRADFKQAEQMIGEALAGFANARWVTSEMVDCLLAVARLATLRQQFARAATLFGLVRRLQLEIHHTVDTPMRPLIDAALATVQAALDPAVFAATFSAGEQLALGQAFATILAPSQD